MKEEELRWVFIQDIVGGRDPEHSFSEFQPRPLTNLSPHIAFQHFLFPFCLLLFLILAHKERQFKSVVGINYTMFDVSRV